MLGRGRLAGAGHRVAEPEPEPEPAGWAWGYRGSGNHFTVARTGASGFVTIVACADAWRAHEGLPRRTPAKARQIACAEFVKGGIDAAKVEAQAWAEHRGYTPRKG